MLILTIEEFNNKFNIDNNAMSDIRIKDIGKEISNMRGMSQSTSN